MLNGMWFLVTQLPLLLEIQARIRTPTPFFCTWTDNAVSVSNFTDYDFQY